MGIPRRAFLGAAVANGEDGVEITRVWPGSMAERAGAEPGDRIRAFGAPVGSVAELVAACREHAGRPKIRLALERGRAPYEVEVDYVPFPTEAAPGSVVYGEAAGLRTIEVVPDGGASAELVFLPGLPYESVDFAMREAEPTARFLVDLARSGIATLRIERPGLGDSPGARCAGFLAEQRAYRDALEARARGLRRAIFGHSVGGMHAPLLADLADSVIVYGTSARRWSECLAASRDRQRALRGLPPADGPPGWPPERSPRFHQELDAIDLRAAWAAVRAPVLVVAGEHDWVVGDEDPRALGGEVRVLDGLDHAFTRHATREASLAALGRGEPDPRVAAVCAEWLAR